MRADLADRGVDLGAWVRRRRVRDLLDLIDQLPVASRFREALQNDPQYAAAVAQAEEEARTLLQEDDRRWHPPVAEYDLHSRQLHDIRELLVQLIDVSLTGTRRKSSGIPRFPSPHTAIDDAREELRVEGYYESLAIFSPHAVNPAPPPVQH